MSVHSHYSLGVWYYRWPDRPTVGRRAHMCDAPTACFYNEHFHISPTATKNVMNRLHFNYRARRVYVRPLRDNNDEMEKKNAVRGRQPAYDTGWRTTATRTDDKRLTFRRIAHLTVIVAIFVDDCCVAIWQYCRSLPCL